MLTRSEPSREMTSLRRAIDDLLERSMIRPWLREGLPEELAPLDVQETDQGYHVRVATPGFEPEDLEVIVQGNTLTVRGEIRQEKQAEQRKRGNWVRREIRFAAFERSITLDRPIDPDKITVSYENGILTLDIPAREVTRSRRLTVTKGQQAKAVGAGRT